MPGRNASTSEPTRQRRARGSLSHEEIRDAARRLIEDHGLDQLSYPRLAKELNAGAASLCSYYRTKDELVAAVVDEVTREMYLHLAPMGDGPWDVEFVEYQVAFRKLLVSSPVYREVFAYRAQTLFRESRLAPSILRGIETDLAVMVRAGLTPEEAAQAFKAFSSFTRAFALAEQGVDSDPLDEDARQLMNLTFSHLAAGLPGARPLQDVEDLFIHDEALFRTGLGFLVAGLRQRYPALRRNPARRVARKRASA